MASRQGFLVNQATPSLVLSPVIDCAEGAVRITCSGMGATGAAWQVWVGSTKVGSWTNVVRYGVPVIMSSNMSQYVELFAGRYRVDPAGLLGSSVVFFQEDEETDHDSKVLYTFAQQNNNQNGITGESTITNAVVGNGTNANPLGYNVIVSPDANNGLSVHPNGLFATEGISTVQDTATVDLGGLGTVASPLTANAIVSPDAGNGLSAHPNGLFATSVPSKLNAVDALALITAYFGTFTGISITGISVSNINLTSTTSDTVYGVAQLTGTLSAASGTFEALNTAPAQGSIGPTVAAMVVGGTSDATLANAVIPTQSSISASNVFVTTFSTIGDLVHCIIQIALTLQ